MQNFQNVLNTIVEAVVSGALTIASVYVPILISKVVKVANSKASLIKNEEAQAIVTNAIDRIDDLITTNIISAENTLKPKILEAIKDGKIDKSELEELSKIVKENVLKQISEDVNEVLNTTVSDTSSYLENRIEKILAELKNSAGNVVTHTEV